MRLQKFRLDKLMLAKILIIISLIVIDIATKVFFAQYFASGKENIEILWGLITFTYVENTGAAFGSFASGTIILTIVSFVFATLWIVMDIYSQKQTRIYVYSFTLIVAGAIGNLIDRLFLGYVRDFIKFSMFGFVCNIADICITLGVILYAVYILLDMFKERNKDKVNDERNTKG